MFEFLKKSKSLPATGSAAVRPFVFKNAKAALDHACDYLKCPLGEGEVLPALVVDIREVFGVQKNATYQDSPPVIVEENGAHKVGLRVASGDGGFMVIAVTAGRRGPKLQPGQLVAWRAMQYVPEFGVLMTDKRSGWIGVVLGTLKPKYDNDSESWVGDEKFLP